MSNIRDRHSFYLGGADGMRALACLAVIFHHFAQRLAMQQQYRWLQEIQSLFLMGNSGVSVFFVLSGFLLSFQFWRNYLLGQEIPNIRQYFLRRVVRIVPGYYFVFLVCTLLVLQLKIPSEYLWQRLAAGLTFTASFHYVTFFRTEIDGPLWSIGFEAFCYIMLPLFMTGLFMIVKRRSFVKSVLYWIAVLLFIFVANRLVHGLLTPDSVQRGWQYGLIGGAKYWMPNYNPIGLFGHFTIGIIAAGVSARLQRTSARLSKFEEAGGFDWMGSAGLLLSLLLLWIFRRSPEFSASLQHQPYFFPYFAILVSLPLIAAPRSRYLHKWLDNVLFTFIARISFGLYLWHHLIITIAALYWVKDYQYMGLAAFPRWVMISMTIFSVSMIIASISYCCIEKPVLDWAHKRRKRLVVPIKPDQKAT